MWQLRLVRPLVVVCALTIIFLILPILTDLGAAPQITVTVRPAEHAELGMDVLWTDHAVYVDGVAGKNYDEIDTILIEPRGRHVAYKAKRGKGWLVVRDGVEGKPYGDIIGLRLSPDGSRVSYRVATGKSAFSAVGPIIVDGPEHREYPRVQGPGVVFSPNGRRIAYWAEGEHYGKSVLVVDDVDGIEFDAPIEGLGHQAVFSPDSRHIAYTGRRGMKQVAVVDGVEVTECDGIVVGTLVFSPDGQHIAYAARIGKNKARIVLEGAGGKEYDAIVRDSVAFSPDGGHIGYVASRGGKLVVVVDAAEGAAYDRIPDGQVRTTIGFLNSWFEAHPDSVAPVLSPDGKRVAYSARRGKATLVVVDGVESGGYDETVSQTPVFSPDGRHTAWAALVGGKYRIFVDGSEIKDRAFDDIYCTNEGTLVFDSPTHFRALASVALAGRKKNEKQFLRVDVEIGPS